MFTTTLSSSLALLFAFQSIKSTVAQTQPAIEKIVTIPRSILADNLDVDVAEGSGNITVTCHSCGIEAKVSVAAGGPSLGGARSMPTNWEFDVQDFDLSQDWVALGLPNRADSLWVMPNFTVQCDPGSAGFCQGQFALSKKGGNGIETPLEIVPGLTVTTPVVFDIRVNTSKLANFGIAFSTHSMTGTFLVPLSGDVQPKLIGMNDGLFVPVPQTESSSHNTLLESSTEGLEMDVSMSVRLELRYTLTKDGAAPNSATHAAEIPRFDLSAKQVSNVTEYCIPIPQTISSSMDAYDNVTNLTRTVSFNGLTVNGAGASQTFGTTASYALDHQCYSYDAETKSLVWHTGARTVEATPPGDGATQHGVFVAMILFFSSLTTFFLPT